MLNRDFYTITPSQSLKLLNTTKNGLNTETAQNNLKNNGKNEIGSTYKKSKIKMFFSQFCDVMIVILLVASVLSIIISVAKKTPDELVDGFIILFIVLLNALIGFFQENKAEKSMDALKKLTHRESKVYRDGVVKIVSSDEIVVGDVIALESGDIVPADCRLLEAVMLSCDESSLTGESIAVKKDSQCVLSQNTILAERKNMVFGGTIISSGRGLALVVKTGHETEIGKIAKLIQSTKKDETPLQKGINQVGKVVTILVLTISAITFGIELYAVPENPLEAFLTAIAIAVAAIPESLPAVITIIMSLGVARLVKRKAIVKRLHAVETLGNCEIICTDKTGTLTQNQMSVQALYYGNKLDLLAKVSAKSLDYNRLLSSMILCNNAQQSKTGIMGDPTEKALLSYANKYIKLNQFDRIGEIPFDSTRKLMTTEHFVSKKCVVTTKGAVDELLQKCYYIQVDGKILPLDDNWKRQILQVNVKMGSSALRVLGFAFKELETIKSQTTLENNLVFVGMVGLIDPPRREVKKAVEQCHKAGIKPIMITGDHKTTAVAIAKQVGISNSEKQAITGAEIDKLSDSEFDRILDNFTVFARVSPENKVRIVDAFKRRGNIVAMTGDGVNDAPSIKKADIGVGMGISGTDVTKEVADLIVTDDNFATIIVAVEEGRKIYSNIQKTITFLFSANLAELTAIFLATIFWPQIVFLSPVQILFVNLLSDTFPAIALGLEPAESNIMEKKPRKNASNLFSGGIWEMIIVLGLLQGIVMLGCFLYGVYICQDQATAMSMAFYALNVIQLFFFVSIRANGNVFKNNIFKSKWSVGAMGFCVGIIVLIACTPLHSILKLESLTLGEWSLILCLGIAIFITSEFVKKYLNKKHNIDN